MLHETAPQVNSKQPLADEAAKIAIILIKKAAMLNRGYFFYHTTT